MGAGERTIRIKFDGTAKGLKRAANDVAKTIDGVTAKVRAKAGTFARLGQKIGLDLTNGISGAFKSMPPQLQAAVVAIGTVIGVTMSSAVGAALTAGILLAVGGGVIAAGIKAAAKSPQVQAAWKTFNERAKKALAGFSAPFEGPVARALDTFADAIERMAPTLKDMGKSMAPVIDRLAPALAKMAENSLPGIKKAMEASKPLFDTLADHLPKIGDSISKAFGHIAKGGPGANKFLEDFLWWLAKIIEGLGWLIGGLARFYGWFKENIAGGLVRIWANVAGFILDRFADILDAAATAFGWIPGLGPKLEAARQKFAEFRKRVNAELALIKSRTVTVTVVSRRLDDGSRHSHTSNAGGGREGGRERRAVGGPVSAGRTYLVGERGPELVTMGANGHVTPNHQLGGDTHVTVVIDGRALDESMVRVTRERDRRLKQQALAGVR